MPNPTIVSASLDDKELKQSIANLVAHVKRGLHTMLTDTNSTVDAMEKKLKSLGNLKIDSSGSSDGGSSKRTSAVKNETRARKELNMTLDQQASAINAAAQSEKKYTDEIRRQAQAIREMQTWKEKGYAIVDGNVYHDPERSNVAKKNRISLEEQISQKMQAQKTTEEHLVRTEQERAEAVKVTRDRYAATNEQLEKARQLSNKGIGTTAGDKNGSVPTFTTQLESANALSKRLKELKEQYNSLSYGKRLSAEGQAIALQIREITRQGQKLSNELNRPTKKEVFGLSEKTLDDMAYKMRQLASYRSGLNIKTQSEEIEQVNKKYAELQKGMNDIMRKNTEMIKSNTALGRSWNYMKNRLAFYFTVGASTQFVKNLIEVRSQYEMNERALGILINSAERGTQIFNELSQMALVSPYTLIELSTAAKQLTAYDVAAKDVVDTTRRLADMASAVGIPIERLTYALGQIKAYGYLNSRDARMFANAGIPLVKQLSDYYTQLEGRLVSTADVYDRIKKKTIDYEQVVQVINKMTDEGGKFFDFQAKMADTLKVRLANLTLAWNNMLNDMGSSNQGVLTTGIGLLRDMFLHWKDLESAISKVATAFGIYKTAQLVTLIWTGRITTAMGVQELVGKKLQARFTSLTIAQKGFVSAATAGWAALAFVVADAWLTISRNMEEIEQLNKSIADGAKESYEAIDKMLHSSEMVSTRLSAAQGKLSDTDAAKAWEMLREQIELSAASSKELIAQLLKEPDINKRVTESFNLAEKIEEANRRLSDLNDSLDVSQNSILGGLLGEGLAEDIDDYNARIKYETDLAEWAAKKNRGFWENAIMGLSGLFNEVKESLGESSGEAKNEIINFSRQAAQTIKDELGEEALKDKVQVNEAIARVIKGMEQQFPQIRGKGKTLFETIFYDVMAKEFSGAVDSQAYYYEKFLGQLKKDHASAFTDVTEDINKDTHKWSSAQLDAIQKTADKVKKDLPAASQGAIDEILRQLNSTDFKVRIIAEMATTSLDNVQKQFREKFIEKPWIADDKEREKEENEANQKYGTLMRKNTESNAEYEKRISDERKKQLELSQKNAEIISNNKEKQDDFSKAVTADAQKQKKAADDWLKAAKEIEDAGGYDFSTKKENAADRNAAKQAETELQKALKDELSTIDKVRSIYKDLTKEGMSHADAVERATKGWEETVNAINRVLQKNGLQKLDLSKFAGIDNPRELVNMLQSQLNALVGRAKPSEIKELQTKIQTLSVDADKYDLTKITKGLNSELDRLKEEYELAVALDADPELGSMFADWMGIDMDNLPRTAQEYAKRATDSLNKALKERKADIELPNMLNITDDDLRELQNRVGTGGITQTYVDEITKAVKDVRGVFKKEKEDTSKEWNVLVEKYGGLQAKILQIYKNNVQQQASIVRSFGTNEEQLKALDLISKIKISQDPAEIARLQEELGKVMSDVTSRNPVALKTYQAVRNEQGNQTGKAYWEDFKDSDLYAMTFTDMANNSTQAIQLIIDKLNELKFKVKEDPASMKALIKSLEDAENELISRDPFAGIANSISTWIKATKEQKEAQEELELANKEVAGSEIALKNAQSVGDKKSIVKAEQQLAQAQQKQATAQGKVVQSGNKAKKAQEQLKTSLQNLSNELGNVSGLLGSVSKIFRAVGDDDTADAIDAINEGFTIMTTVIMGVMAALTLLQTSNPWLLAIAAALSVIVGLVSFLSGNSNKKITQQVEESEKAVKRLENSYKRLEYAAEQAFGAATSGAQQALKANKELQLFELRRQLALEESRSGKNYDEDKVLDLKGQIIDLEHEIKDFTKNAVNDLLGISSHGEFFESMISEMIDAFKSGEDAMKVFEEKWSGMIDNMIMKTMVSQVLQQWINSLEKGADSILDKYTKEQSDAMAKLNNDMADVSLMDAGDAIHWIYQNDAKAFKDILDQLGEKEFFRNPQNIAEAAHNVAWFDKAFDTGLAKQIQDIYIANMESRLDDLSTQLDKASLDATGELIEYYGQAGEEFKTNYLDLILGKIKENWTFGQDNENKLSQLQQGISGITENQAGALEAYWNANTQQQYVQSDLLREIRNLLAGGDADIQTGVQAQMLLQLQQSYQVQMSIENILQSVLNPSGRAFSVELIS